MAMEVSNPYRPAGFCWVAPGAMPPLKATSVPVLDCHDAAAEPFEACMTREVSSPGCWNLYRCSGSWRRLFIILSLEINLQICSEKRHLHITTSPINTSLTGKVVVNTPLVHIHLSGITQWLEIVEFGAKK